MTTGIRIAFCGASGTGKSTLAKHLAELHKLPENPIGSRSVAKAMGFESPYDVDKAGKRAEFQARLIQEKVGWEIGNDSFVTDRTTMDNVAYTMLHDVYSVDAKTLELAIQGLARYTHIFYCPMDVFCNPGDDAARVKDMTYQRLYDACLCGLLDKFLPFGAKLLTVAEEGLTVRKSWVESKLRFGEGIGMSVCNPRGVTAGSKKV